MTDTPELLPCPTGAIEQLNQYQQQLDNEGVYVGVSRQALDEVLAYVAARTPPKAEPMSEHEALASGGDWMEGDAPETMIKPLIWYDKPKGQDARIGRCASVAYSVSNKLGSWGYTRQGDVGHTISYKGCCVFTDEQDAMDGADEDHVNRITETLNADLHQAALAERDARIAELESINAHTQSMLDSNIKITKDLLTTARNDALEEAAQAAQSCYAAGSEDDYQFGCDDAACTIRALKSEGEG
jgi:hypothetical protein